MHEVTLLTTLFLILLVLPFIPSVLELLLKRDKEPIPIDIDHEEKPYYFGERFVNLLATSLKELGIQEIEKMSPVNLRLKLNREEWFNFVDDEKLVESVVDKPTVFTKPVTLLRNHTFKKELAVFGETVFLGSCVTRSLYVEGDCLVITPIRIVRWTHVEGTLIVEANADLGVSVYAYEMKINGRTTFKRGYARKIATENEPTLDKEVLPDTINLQGGLSVKGNVAIDGAKRMVVVDGDIFSKSDIEVEGRVWIKGNVFTQGSVTLKNGVVVGVEGKVKSVVARGEISIKGPFKVYGYIHSERIVEVEP